MTPEPHTYDELAQSVLRDYLRSAVIIDDQWPETTVTDLTSENLDESELINDRIPDGGDMEDAEIPVEDLPPPRPPDNPADARLLVELQRFLLQEGLLTCGFRYTHQSRDVAIELARRADIVVLDWHLVADDGADALAILKELQGNDLRFVFIFTGHGRIPEVRRALEDHLGSKASEDSGADLRIGNLVVAIRNKKGVEEEAQGLTVGAGELLAAALRGLASNYDGLVQLAMLELTQRHRRQLPAILERFDRSIDTAVLLEAGDESSPVGQRGAFLAVLVDEWRAHLEQEHSRLRVLGPEGLRLYGSQLSESLPAASAEKVQESLAEVGIKKKTAEAFAKKATTTGGLQKLHEWLTKGCEGGVPPVHGGDLREESRLAGWGTLRAVSEKSGEPPYAPMLRLDALFHQQFDTPGEVTQGTLVAIDQDAEYFLCITPACDAERPDKVAHLFTFLRSKPILPEGLFTGREPRDAYCVVQDGERLLCLEILLKQKIVLEVKERMFDHKGFVQGRLILSHDRSPELVPLRRVAQLRSEHALSITAAAAADASRVGVSRVELIRRRLS